MKQIKTNSKDIIVVEVPENSFNHELFYDGGTNTGIMFEPRLEEYLQLQSIKFPISSDIKTKILGKLSELKDKDLERFVEKIFEGTDQEMYQSYYYHDSYEITPKQSFISLLQSNGIDTNQELLIIEIYE